MTGKQAYPVTYGVLARNNTTMCLPQLIAKGGSKIAMFGCKGHPHAASQAWRIYNFFAVYTVNEVLGVAMTGTTFKTGERGKGR